MKCYTEDKCQTLPSTGADYKFKQRMAFVSPWLYGKKKKIGEFELSLEFHGFEINKNCLDIFGNFYHTLVCELKSTDLQNSIYCSLKTCNLPENIDFPGPPNVEMVIEEQKLLINAC